MFLFLTIVQAIIAAALVGVILIQRSEGGGLGMGGSPGGLMSARGAADFLTRATSILAALFVGLSVLLAVLAVGEHRSASIDATLERGAGTPAAPAPAVPGGTADPLDPLAGAAGGAPLTAAPAPGAAETAPAADEDPLAAAGR